MHYCLHCLEDDPSLDEDKDSRTLLPFLLEDLSACGLWGARVASSSASLSPPPMQNNYKQTFSVSVVSLSLGSECLRRLCWGPGLGFLPAASSSKTLTMDSGVRSSCFHDGIRRQLGGSRVCLRSESRPHIEVVVDLDHRCVRAGTEALHLEQGELLVGRCFAVADLEVALDGVEDGGGVAEHAGGGGADLDKVFSHGFSGARTIN